MARKLSRATALSSASVAFAAPPKLAAGSINPFDTSCDGTACPICK
jgi:hypothetical protein